MGERTAYAPGVFCLTDLATPDLDGATSFYASLLEWEAVDVPSPEIGTYRMFRRDGLEVAAAYSQPESQPGPPAWLAYVAVEDADRATERAVELGATVLMEPFDIPQTGRESIVQDPQGAVFALWQGRERHGAQLVNDPGALCMTQLNAADPDAARAFYTELFGWRFEAIGEDPPYWSVHSGETLNAGMMNLPPGAQGPSHWLVYFTHTDLEAASARIEEGGGEVVVPPNAIPAGRFLVARDPQGAFFALFEGEVDP